MSSKVVFNFKTKENLTGIVREMNSRHLIFGIGISVVIFGYLSRMLDLLILIY